MNNLKYNFSLIVLFLLFYTGCNEKSTSPDHDSPQQYIVKGKVLADGVLLPDTVLFGATVTATNGSQIYNVVSDSFGTFLFNNLSAGLYSLRIEKNLSYGNKVFLDTCLLIPIVDSLAIFVLKKIDYDYFPLGIGNKWQWTGTSSGALIGWGRAAWNDSFRVAIQIMDKQMRADTTCFHFSGEKTYISGRYRPYWNSNDTLILDGITEPIEGYFKEKNGIIITEFISDGSIPGLTMLFFDRDALKGGFHSFLDIDILNKIFYQYSAVTVTEDSLKLTVHVPYKDRNYLPNIGMQSFLAWNTGNNPSGAHYNLLDYSIAK